MKLLRKLATGFLVVCMCLMLIATGGAIGQAVYSITYTYTFHAVNSYGIAVYIDADLTEEFPDSWGGKTYEVPVDVWQDFYIKSLSGKVLSVTVTDNSSDVDFYLYEDIDTNWVLADPLILQPLEAKWVSYRIVIGSVVDGSYSVDHTLLVEVLP